VETLNVKFKKALLLVVVPPPQPLFHKPRLMLRVHLFRLVDD
jgi:hypothetical protein